MKKRAFFLDRDGVLNQVVFREGKVSSPRHLEEFKLIPEAIEFVHLLKQWGFITILVTNQPDVSRNKMSRYQLNQIHQKLREAVPLDRIELCTSNVDFYYRRKPNPGMLLESAKKMDLNLRSSYFLGDSEKDVKAGRNAGVKTILLQTGYNRAIHGMADYNYYSFAEIIDFLRGERCNT